MRSPRIVRISAYLVDRPISTSGEEHWISGKIASPISKYPEYRNSRQSWGKNVLGSIVVEVEASDGTTGFSVGAGGPPAVWIIENHLSNFAIEKEIDSISTIWDQMFLSSIHYGRKGLVLHAISAVDLALWDLLGKLRNKPVYDMLGGHRPEGVKMYATGPNPERAKELGFIGGKLPLVHHPSEGDRGFEDNVSIFKSARESVGSDFMLMYDCWMSLNLQYAIRLGKELYPVGLKWLEECFLPDDYWSYKALRMAFPPDILISAGEHEYTWSGFRLLFEKNLIDIAQPDVTWCGGMTEMIRISKLTKAQNALVIPHCSGVYSYHFVVANKYTPFAEFVMQSHDGSTLVPFFGTILRNDPVPKNGTLELKDEPGFGVELSPSVKLLSKESWWEKGFYQ